MHSDIRFIIVLLCIVFGHFMQSDIRSRCMHAFCTATVSRSNCTARFRFVFAHRVALLVGILRLLCTAVLHDCCMHSDIRFMIAFMHCVLHLHAQRHPLNAWFFTATGSRFDQLHSEILLLVFAGSLCLLHGMHAFAFDCCAQRCLASVRQLHMYRFACFAQRSLARPASFA